MTTSANRTKLLDTVNISTIDAIAAIVGRYGLVVVIGWIGALKFADFEAQQIQPLVAHSPFMGWLYNFLPVYPFSYRSPMQTVSSGSPDTVKFSPNCPGDRSSRPNSRRQ